jgi:hypothetical protein
MHVPTALRRSLPLLGFALLVALVGGAIYLRLAGPEMTAAAQEFLASLDPAQREKTQLAFDNHQRTDWHFIPKASRKGLQIKEMTDPQRKKAHALLSAALSKIGYGKATTIMELEAILHVLEQNRKDGPIRDPQRYYFTIFGQPDARRKWGLSVEGHHLSLNFVLEGEKIVSHTPAFFGANPAIVRGDLGVGPQRGTRVLAKEEELAFELIHSFSNQQREQALIADKAPPDIRAAGEAQPPRTEPEGIPAAALDQSQQATLRALIQAYAENMPGEISAARLGEIEKAGFDHVHFAWAGALQPGIGHYYRVQGPTFLIEFVNTQPDSEGNPANHIHSVWRDTAGDFAIPLDGHAR